MRDSIVRRDHAAMRWVAARRRRPLTLALAVLTYTGAGAVWGISAAALALLCRFDLRILARQETVLAAMFGAGLSLIVGQIVKRLVRRPRPFDVLDDAPVAIPPPTDPSFPSTHTSTAIALLVGLWLTGHPLAPWVTPWALALPLTRFYLGAHYPTDVLAGAALGALFGLVDYTPVMVWALSLGPG
ncbi:MAG: phosphatase PAP2 family protein [Myxococcota bacterium]|nr:phosphatase PAP2 family protein [Myxococcota bacterium]